jgi:hypothetical protein
MQKKIPYQTKPKKLQYDGTVGSIFQRLRIKSARKLDVQILRSKIKKIEKAVINTLQLATRKNLIQMSLTNRNANLDLEAINIRFSSCCIVGCIFYSAGLIITREIPCI